MKDFAVTSGYKVLFFLYPLVRLCSCSSWTPPWQIRHDKVPSGVPSVTFLLAGAQPRAAGALFFFLPLPLKHLVSANTSCALVLIVSVMCGFIG